MVLAFAFIWNNNNVAGSIYIENLLDLRVNKFSVYLICLQEKQSSTNKFIYIPIYVYISFKWLERKKVK